MGGEGGRVDGQLDGNINPAGNGELQPLQPERNNVVLPLYYLSLVHRVVLIDM